MNLKTETENREELDAYFVAAGQERALKDIVVVIRQLATEIHQTRKLLEDRL